MHRSWSILLATTALLAGCSSGSSAPTTVTVTSPAPSGDSSVVTDRHPTNTDLFSSQFHPCEVFTEEQFAQAGLGKRLNVAEDPVSRVRSCAFAYQDTAVYEGSFLIGTDTVDKTRILELGLEPADWSASGAEGIYIHRMPTEARSCSAAYDFDWGRFFVDYRELGTGWDPEFLCSLNVEILTSLIEQGGGDNGTQN